jgi:hypothetical protein
MNLLSAKTVLHLAPALFLFGPIIVAIAIEGPMHAWAGLGALMTGLGCLIVYANLLRQSLLIDELTRRLEDRSAAP